MAIRCNSITTVLSILPVLPLMVFLLKVSAVAVVMAAAALPQRLVNMKVEPILLYLLVVSVGLQGMLEMWISTMMA